MKSAQLHQKATNLENVSCFELENNMGKKRWQRVHVMENCNWWKEFNVRILYTSSIHWILTWLAGGWGSTESIQLQNALNTISSWDLNHSKWEIPVFQGVYLKRTGQDPRNTSTPFEAWDLGKDPKQKSTNKWQVPKRKGSFLGILEAQNNWHNWPIIWTLGLLSMFEKEAQMPMAMGENILSLLTE